MTTRLTHLPLLLLVFLSALSSQLSAASVKLAWDANTEPDLAGYRLYWGAQTRRYTNLLDSGLLTTNEVPGLTPGDRLFLAVTAYNTNGLESDYSNEVALTVPLESTPPAAPTGLRVIAGVDWLAKTNKGLVIPTAVIRSTPGNVLTATLRTPTGLVTRSLTIGTNGLALLSGRAAAPPFTAALEITKLTFSPNEEHQAAFR